MSKRVLRLSVIADAVSDEVQVRYSVSGKRRGVRLKFDGKYDIDRSGNELCCALSGLAWSRSDSGDELR